MCVQVRRCEAERPGCDETSFVLCGPVASGSRRKKECQGEFHQGFVRKVQSDAVSLLSHEPAPGRAFQKTTRSEDKKTVLAHRRGWGDHLFSMTMVIADLTGSVWGDIPPSCKNPVLFTVIWELGTTPGSFLLWETTDTSVHAGKQN